MKLGLNRRDATAAGLGVVSALALPPLTVLPVLWFCLPGLLRLISEASSWRSAFRAAFIFALFHHMIGLWWITEAVMVMAAQFWWAIPIAVPLLSAVLALFIALPAVLAFYTRPGLPRVLMLCGAWVLGDLARQFFLTGFPWNLLGTTVALPGGIGDALLQAASLGTVHLLTLLVLLVTFLPVLGRRGVYAAVALGVLWLSYGFARLAPVHAAGFDAVLVQGNVAETDNRDHWQDRLWLDQVFQHHLDLTRQGVAAAPSPALVVWPETASPWWLEQDPQARAMIAAAGKGALGFLVGAPRDGLHNDPRNALIAIAPSGAVAATYDKTHLVPYGEYFPSYLPIRLGERGWTPGPGIRTLHMAGVIPFGPLICFEAIFPGQVVDETDRPKMLVNITNDAWFGNSSGPRQHLVQARLRAIEEGLPLLRAANTGISALIDPYGRVTALLGLGLTGYVRGEVAEALPAPLAARSGLGLPGLLALGLCLGAAFLSRRRGKPGQHP
jgi:apolipoprotein N-acyltransferase